ncbi:MAG: hypothetical protein A3C84_04195 [Candidatus Ryanbacteria bacterium RIFCSPHIGHO2_02_FULL_48_12]|uniref:Nudix hydrolase domain-containing protein n=1 Tax=Candidatus Ryanbacteria bacterium RIFCSPHIGHO2_01_FULL_48_27 TaxID=1802115 RepID=A0A1G2G5J2_9BACT|nr:MAG: hypothetical protein A2756_00760 [Candidatus Ryanbacteria bacterium RIFCSPHIGHO2_01_FULL_48_27]OGZ48564.1 MAG: hypothetical protein A3C84_04195 [Candidatus Ryanbacteria bacterium RIFCSPHIGHO2_02_FULL_48_12]
MQNGAKAIVHYQGKFLFILRDNIPGIRNPNIWNIPGGRVEEGETWEECLKRELEEEICIVPKNIIYMGKSYFQRVDGTIAFYLVLLNDEEYKRVKLGNEGQKLEFFTPQEIIQLPLADTKEFYTSLYPIFIRIAGGESDFRPEELQLEE